MTCRHLLALAGTCPFAGGFSGVCLHARAFSTPDDPKPERPLMRQLCSASQVCAKLLSTYMPSAIKANGVTETASGPAGCDRTGLDKGRWRGAYSGYRFGDARVQPFSKLNPPLKMPGVKAYEMEALRFPDPSFQGSMLVFNPPKTLHMYLCD